MTSHLHLYSRAYHTGALGPDIRHALWVQGCPFRCPGCMTPDARPFGAAEVVAVADLAADILNRPGIEGLTVTGGEPFAQAEALAELVAMVRDRHDLGLIIYTGFRLEELQLAAPNDAGTASLLARTDLLVDGRYVQSLNDGAALKGSANQRVIPLSKRYLDHLHLYEAARSRQVEVHLDVGWRMLVGVPSAEQLAWWRSGSGEGAPRDSAR